MEIEYQLTLADYLEALSAMFAKSRAGRRHYGSPSWIGLAVWLVFVMLVVALYVLMRLAVPAPFRPIIPTAEKAAEAELALAWVTLLGVMVLIAYAQRRGRRALPVVMLSAA